MRIRKMEDQNAVAETVHLLDQQNPQDLFGTQSPCATTLLLVGAGRARGAQVLPDQLLDLRMVVEETGNGLQLGGVGELEPVFA